MNAENGRQKIIPLPYRRVVGVLEYLVSPIANGYERLRRLMKGCIQMSSRILQAQKVRPRKSERNFETRIGGTADCREQRARRCQMPDLGSLRNLGSSIGGGRKGPGDLPGYQGNLTLDALDSLAVHCKWDDDGTYLDTVTRNGVPMDPTRDL
jgi:hypothetical protein